MRFHKEWGDSRYSMCNWLDSRRTHRYTIGSSGYRQIQPLEDVAKTDLIIIPAVNGNMNEVISSNKDFFPWINATA